MLKRCLPREYGFSLIELMVIIAILAILTMTAVPAFTTWIANTRVRSVAEALQNALRQAQGEAIKDSRQVVLALTSSSPTASATPVANGSNWYVQTLPLTGSDETDGTYIRGETVAKAQSVSITGPALLCFSSMGRLVSNTSTGLGSDCAAPASFTSYTLAASGADRPMKIEVYLGGKVRMCDPAKTLSTTNPDGCA